MSATAGRIEPDRVRHAPIVGLAVDSVLAADLLDHRNHGTAAEFGRSVELAGVDFLVFGRDRLSVAPPETSTLDPTVAAVVVARHTADVGIVVTAGAGREHPYNIARRLASVDHGSRGRVGWLTGTVDRAEPHADAVWVDADPLDAAADAVAVVRSLWGSWPAVSIVRDRNRGVFAESGRIVHIDHDGVYRVAGPLNVPEPPQARPPVFWSPRSEREELVAGRTADVVVVADEASAARLRASFDSAARNRVLLADVTWTQGREPIDTSIADGVLVHGATPETWPRVLAAVARPPSADGRRVTLRERLGLAAPEPRTVGIRSAFPVA